MGLSNGHLRRANRPVCPYNKVNWNAEGYAMQDLLLILILFVLLMIVIEILWPERMISRI